MAKVVMGKRSRFKIQRRLGVELPGLGRPGALDKRPFGPGQHGNTGGRRQKLSEFAIRLREKQKMLFHYGLREQQMRNYVKRARRVRGKPLIDALVGLIERRLDNLVFRLGFAPSMAAARQLVAHGHVLVNGRKLDVPAAILRPGDKVALTKKGYQSQGYLQARSNPRIDPPDWLTIEIEQGERVGKLNEEPDSTAVPFAFNGQYVVEYYSAVG